MIGQYGHFDEHKYARDFKANFFGMEACLFSTIDDCLRLQNEAKRRGFQVGIHFPLRAGVSKLRDALFLSRDTDLREQAFTYIEEELKFLKEIELQPEYILFHYPKPVILDDRVAWNEWRFEDQTEFVFESDYTSEEFIKNSDSLFQWLSVKSDEHRFIPVLEFDALNRYIYDTEFLEQLLDKYPKIKLCLDTARLYLQDKLDPYFDAKHIFKKFSRYAYSIHLSTVQVQESIKNKHYPVLPHLEEGEGWAPIADYLKIIVEENSHVKVMFEHRSDLISKEQLEEVYVWVEELLKKE